MFEINKNAEVRAEQFFHSNLYVIDDFYLNPDEVVEYITKTQPPLWKIEEGESNNGILYEDRRLVKDHPDITEVYQALSSLCGQPPADNRVITNQTRFIDKKSNTYETHYWYPHIDNGYNGIVYLNHDDFNGTNLYDVKSLEEIRSPFHKEHENPWRKKENFIVLKEIKPKYNRMVLFDGLFLHGMNISNDTYFSDEYRLNQVFFFQNK